MAVWVTTDLHGNYNLWEQIKNFLKEDDTLIFLGDAIDRGSRGFEIFKELLEHDQVVYLRGNHEQMMYDAYTIIGPAATESWKHWRNNGGQATVNNMKSLNLGAETELDLIHMVQKLPLTAEYENEMGMKFVLCHAGFTPGRSKNLLWDRKHLNDSLDHVDDNYVIVHGHTPVAYQRGYESWNEARNDLTPNFYANGHKINIDMGVYGTNVCCLLDLDTFEYCLFTTKK